MNYLIKFFFCGILTSFLFPPFLITPIGFIVFPFLFFLFNDKNFKNFNYSFHFLSGFIYGLGFLLIYLGWINEPFLLDKQTKIFSPLSYLLIFYCSVYFGFIFMGLKFFKNILLKFLIFPILIVLGEFLCSNIWYGFPWISYSLLHSNNDIGLTLIYYLGTYGLSYVTIFIYLFPVLFLETQLKLNKTLLLFYLIFFILLFIAVLNRNNYDNYTQNKEINVSISQLNFPIDFKPDKSKNTKKIEKIIRLIKENRSDIIIFAENNFPNIISNEKDLKFLQNDIEDNHFLIIGSTSRYNKNFYNSFFLIDNTLIQRFDKKILVPFGEFIPLRNYFSFMDFIVGTNDFSTGQQERKLQIKNNIKILPVVCYEIMYFWRLMNQQNYDANIIVNLTNDKWFGDFSGPYQHFYFSKLRAAEFNKPLIRVSNNGISAVIDNYGNILDYISLNKRAIKKIKINNISPFQNYVTLHQYFIIFIFLFLIFCFLLNKKYDS